MKMGAELLEELTSGRACGFVTYSGKHISAAGGSPDIIDIAVGLGRIGRWGGQSLLFWPVLLHSMVVADLLPTHLEAHGLLHDATEILIGDVPRAFKLPEVSALEEALHERIAEHLGLPPINAMEREFIRHADNHALLAEAWVVCSGYAQKIFSDSGVFPDPVAVQLVEAYLDKYPPERSTNLYSGAVLDFSERVARALERIKQK